MGIWQEGNKEVKTGRRLNEGGRAQRGQREIERAREEQQYLLNDGKSENERRRLGE